MANCKQIAFVDPSISDLPNFLAGLRPDVEAIVLAPSEPALAQIARVLKDREGIDALHIVAHGRPGEVSFGAGALSLERLEAGEPGLAAVGRALDADGEILLWTCNS